MSAKVEWNHLFPVSWKFVPSKRLFPESKLRAGPDDEQLTASQDWGVIPQKEFVRRAGRRVVEINQHLDMRKRVERDDFVISMRSFQGGLERAWAEGGIRSSYVVLKPSSAANVGYFARLFKCEQYIRALQATAHFIRDGQDLNYQNFCLVDLPLPPQDEQAQIARFLDHETARIDALIDKQQQLTALLKEKRQAVISHAVTKGLNPNAPLRDSGVEWLGMVPAHWAETPLKAFLSLKHGYAFDGNAFTDSGEFMLMTPGNFNEEGGFREKVPEKFYARQDFPRSFILENGQMLVAMTEQGPGLLGCALIVPDTGRYLHNQRLGLVCGLNQERLYPRFLFHLFNSARYRAEVSTSATGVKVRHTSPGRMLSVKVWLPSVAEQEQIAGFIDRQLAAIESMNAKAAQIVSFLQERRTALISAAVTGKIDVRNWAPPESKLERDVA